jgi:hypothetical protein
LPRLGVCGRQTSIEIAAPAKQGSPSHWKYSKAHTGSRFASKLPYVYDYVTKLFKQEAGVIQNHENANVRNIEKDEIRHRKYKRLKLGGCQAYDRSSD